MANAITNTEDYLVLVFRQLSPAASYQSLREMLLTLAVFGIPVKVLYQGEAVKQLLSASCQQALPCSPTTFSDYGINPLYVEQAGLERYDISRHELIDDILVVNQKEMRQILFDAKHLIGW